MNKALIIGLIVALTTSIVYYNKYSTTLDKLADTTANIKAYVSENSKLESSNRIFKFTVNQLNYYNDSIMQKLNDVRKELKIKDKNLLQMQYLLSQSQRIDTISFTDTLFLNPTLNIDTVIGDDWYTLKLGLRYPNSIITAPTFNNETYIVVSSKRETINPPKKFFLLRWFQKKHIIHQVDVVEKNPYSKIKQQRFIEITK